MTLYPRSPEDTTSTLRGLDPDSLQDTTSQYAISAMGVIGDGKNPSAVTRLTTQQREELLKKLSGKIRHSEDEIGDSRYL